MKLPRWVIARLACGVPKPLQPLQEGPRRYRWLELTRRASEWWRARRVASK